MLTRWEVEGELRSLQPFRKRSRRSRAALARRRRLFRIALAVVVGIGVLGAFGIANLLRSGGPAFTSRQSPAWGEVHVGSSSAGTRPLRSVLPQAWRRGWHPHDPRGHALRDRHSTAADD